MFGRKRFQLATTEAQVVRAAVAVVEGRTLPEDLWGSRGRRWILRLAHIRWDELQRVAASRPYPASGWDAAASYVARDVLETTKSAENLLALQRDLLIPLELEMLAGRLDPPTTPADLVKVVDPDRRSHL